jgi:hypothetical protein
MLALAPSYTHRELFWEDFLNLYKKKNFVMQFDEDANQYLIYGYDGPEVISTMIYKNEIPQALSITQEQNDLYKTAFETIYKSKCNGTIDISKNAPFSEPCGLKFFLKGVSGVAIAGQTTDIFYKTNDVKRINGCKLILNGHTENDTFDILVVDYDNVMGYGAGAILDTYGSLIRVDESVREQFTIESKYSALMPSGLYIVARYNSAGANNVRILINIFFHRIVA